MASAEHDMEINEGFDRKTKGIPCQKQGYLRLIKRLWCAPWVWEKEVFRVTILAAVRDLK